MTRDSHHDARKPSPKAMAAPPPASSSAPVFSVITPVYNGEAFIDRCYRCLALQTFTDWEWVVIDDGSTDRTAEQVRRIADPRVRLTSYQPNRGRGYARLQALQASRGDWMVVWDVDDLHCPDRLARIHEARRQGYEFFCSYAVLVDNDLQIKGVRGFIPPAGCLPMRFVHPTLACPMRLARKIGYTSSPTGEDALLILTLAGKHRGYFCEEAVSIYQEDREVHLQKAIDSNWQQWRTVRQLFRTGVLPASFWHRAALDLRWGVKLALLEAMRIMPRLYLKTVKYRNQGCLAADWELSEDRTRFLDQFRFPLSSPHRKAA